MGWCHVAAAAEIRTVRKLRTGVGIRIAVDLGTGGDASDHRVGRPLVPVNPRHGGYCGTTVRRSSVGGTRRQLVSRHQQSLVRLSLNLPYSLSSVPAVSPAPTRGD